MYYSTIGIMVKGGTDVKVLKIDRSLWDAARPGFIRFKRFCPPPPFEPYAPSEPFEGAVKK